MGVAYNSSIVTNGLVLCLDAGNPRSYPGTGTNWFDASLTNSATSLVSAPTYSTANLGTFTFNGTTNLASLANNSTIQFTNITVHIWCTGGASTSFKSPIMKTTSGAWTDGFGMHQSSNTFGFWVNSWTGTPFASITLPGASFSITCWTGTYDGANVRLYQNGTLVKTNPYTTAIANSAGALEIGRGGGAAYYWDGNINQVILYNRALTDSEVLQNFNATRGRYGI